MKMRRFLAVLITLAMVASVLPMQASANGLVETPDVTGNDPLHLLLLKAHAP